MENTNLYFFQSMDMKLLRKTHNFFSSIISYKVFLILLIIAVSIMLFPMYYISNWDVPSADDYTYTSEIHHVVMNGGSLLEIIKADIDVVVYAYHNWSGLFGTYALTMFNPIIYGSQNYFIVPYIMISILILGIFFFITEIFSVFAVKKKFGIMISLVLIIACTQFLPSPVQGFYWYSGAGVYTLSFGLSLIYYALIILWVEKRSNVSILLPLIFLSIFIAASNFITALSTAILLISLLILLIILKKDSWKKLLFITLIFGITFYFVVSAPGNNGRKSTDLRLPIIQTIVESLQFALHQIITLNKLSVIALYILLLPILWKIASESTWSFRYPWLVTIYSFCLQASMNSPTIFTDIEIAPGRVENIRYFAMLILFVINIFYWLGWLSKGKFRQFGDRFLQMRVYYLIFSSAIFLYGLTKIPIYRITTLSAVHSYKVGWVGQYKHVYNQRIETLENHEIQDAVLREYPHNKPFVLYFNDISEDPNDWKNIAMSNFYNKNSVRRRHPDEPLPGIFAGD